MCFANSYKQDAVNVSRARSSDGVVALDIERDTYHCHYDPLFDDRLHEDARHLTHLWRDLPPAPPGRPSIVVIIRFTAALLRTIRDIQRLSFADLLDAAPRAPSSGAGSVTDAEACARAVSHFQLLCLFVPFRFQCLFRSYLLLHFLRQHGIHGQWVFGVALFPFEAHCWVVSGDLLLGERAERVASLSPIHIVAHDRP